MARVNVEETIYASIPIIQTITGLKYPEVIGHLVLLWRFSQENCRISGTEEEICDWAWIYKDQPLFIKALIKGQFLRELPCINEDATGMLVASSRISGPETGKFNPDPGNIQSMLEASGSSPKPQFLILGNEKHVKAFLYFKERARKAANARWSKSIQLEKNEVKTIDLDPNNTPSHASSTETDASSMLQEQFAMHSFNSIQCNSIQGNSKKTNAGIRQVYPPEFEDVWTLYQRKGDKRKSLEVWKRLKLSDGEKAGLIKAIKTYQSGKPEIKYRKDLERFLAMDWRELATAEIKPPLTNGHGMEVDPETASRIASFERLNALFESEASRNGVPHA